MVKNLEEHEQIKGLIKDTNNATKRYKFEYSKDELIRELLYLTEQKKYSAFTLVMMFVIGWLICFFSIVFGKMLVEGLM